MKYLIGLDVGTSGAKCIMINETGAVIASSTQEYPLYTPKPGWAEQNPEDWWQGVVRGLRVILEKANVPAEDILGLSYSGQMHGLVALDASNKFGRIGKTTVANADPHNQYITALSLRKGDAAVVISYSGETTDTVNVAREIASAGVDIISLTKFGSSSISELASIRLFTGSTETFMRSGAMSSRLCQMFMIDVLYTSVCSRTYKEIRPHLEKTREAALRMHTFRGETVKG